MTGDIINQIFLAGIMYGIVGTIIGEVVIYIIWHLIKQKRGKK